MNMIIENKNKEFEIPRGTRDLVPNQCYIKRQLQLQIEEVFKSWGYEEIVTPTMEYYKTYRNGFGDLEDEKMFRFFDREGNILSLRMDMTVPIARVVATKFKNSPPPLRFRYCTNIFKVEECLSGRKNELTDCGMELIGLRSEESDLEVLCCAMDVFLGLDISSYVLELGDNNFFRVSCESINLKKEEQAILATLIDNKKLKELEQYVESLDIDREYKIFFMKLPMMFGSREVLEEAKKYCFNQKQMDIIDSLENLSDSLMQLGYEDNIIFDLGKVPRLNYYTGLIFEAYVQGIGSAILSGGRYDELIGKFGRNIPAIGFSIKLDYLLDVITVNKKDERYILYYPVKKYIEALLRARELRKSGKIVELVPCKGNQIYIEERGI